MNSRMNQQFVWGQMLFSGGPSPTFKLSVDVGVLIIDGDAVKSQEPPHPTFCWIAYRKWFQTCGRCGLLRADVHHQANCSSCWNVNYVMP